MQGICIDGYRYHVYELYKMNTQKHKMIDK